MIFGQMNEGKINDFGQANEGKISGILANKRGQEHFCTIIISSRCLWHSNYSKPKMLPGSTDKQNICIRSAHTKE